MRLSDIEYTFEGGELLDRLDNLQGAILTAEQAADSSDTHVDYALGYLESAEEQIDQFFADERIRYPIQCDIVDAETDTILAEDREGEINIDPEGFDHMVEALKEIDPHLGSRTPGVLDYETAPSPCAIIDFSTELIEAYEDMQQAYDALESAS
ncbi:hypothetical protein [Candidatus Nanohalovita haloferacivicina]|uniref:hypothetical protein n=1 Tax=Candidatus Nanohalovita haloferacivicina TaxID=2978046 RepID=UPI00325FC3AF